MSATEMFLSWLGRGVLVSAALTGGVWAGYTLWTLDPPPARLGSAVLVAAVQAAMFFVLFVVPNAVVLAVLYPIGRRVPRWLFFVVAPAALALAALPIFDSDGALGQTDVMAVQLAVQCLTGLFAAAILPVRVTVPRDAGA